MPRRAGKGIKMKKHRDTPGRQGDRRPWGVAAGICAVCFMGCLVWLIFYIRGSRQAEEELENLRREYVKEASGEISDDNETSKEAPSEAESFAVDSAPEADSIPTAAPSALLAYDIPDKAVDISALQANENEDIYAWITVPGTVIDYPVLQHPEQLDYYLKHNVDHSSGYPGCIYSQFLNSPDWDDPNTVLYGHNMKNGSMFAGLHFYEDPQFLEENPYVYIFTENYVRIYHIFGAYEFDNRHLLLTTDMEDAESFARYLEEVRELDGIRDNFLEDVPVSAEDRVLTLETCVANKPDRRYIVQAVLEAEGEWRGTPPREGEAGAEE